MNEDQMRAMLPSARAEAQEEKEKKAREVAESKLAMLREDFGRTFKTAHGKRVLAWMAERCGWGVPPLAADQDGNINEKYTTHNAMELSFYIAIRKNIPIEVLQEVEYGFVKPSGTLEENEKPKPKPKRK